MPDRKLELAKKLQQREEEERKTQLKAKLLKIKLAGIHTPRFPSTPEARRGLVQDTKNPSATVEGSNTQTQSRLRAEGQFIRKKKPIRPTGADAKISPDLKKRLAKIKLALGKKLDFNDREGGRGGRQFKLFKQGDTGDVFDFTKGPLAKEVPFGIKGRNKNLSGESIPQTIQDKVRRRDNEDLFLDTSVKIRPPKPTNLDRMRIIQAKTAHDHGHTIIMKGHTKGLYRSASLENQQGHFAKYWLLNAKQTNGNGWGIASHSAKENMHKFIGRPLVVTSAKWRGSKIKDRYGDTFDHPYVPTNDLNKIFEHQEQYRVGNIVDIGEKNGDYYAMIEMLPKFANMSLPPFCSPAIYQLDAREAEGQISKWEALHLAALDENPAYGARIALLKGTCVGSNNECRIQFKSAKLKETSITCTKGVKSKLSKIKKKLKLASQGLENMTFQDSKKIKIHKRKHPEMRKEQDD